MQIGVLFYEQNETQFQLYYLEFLEYFSEMSAKRNCPLPALRGVDAHSPRPFQLCRLALRADRQVKEMPADMITQQNQLVISVFVFCRANIVW